jgi:methyltransferase (TIGR00027 family)
MATSCSHQDETRKGVGITAHGVACLRGRASSTKDDPTSLIFDPFAAELGGQVGSSWVDSLEVSHRQGMVDGLALRTRKIDDDIVSNVNRLGREREEGDGSKVQVVVLGAGLDSRPWRLEGSITHATSWFEVDFPEIFEYKLPIVSRLINATTSSAKDTLISHIRVDADLSLKTWIDKLIEMGYDSSRPSVWLLEGLTGYLTEDEASDLFSTIRAHLFLNSRVIATFLTPGTGINISMHRFKPSNPMEFVVKFRFNAEQEDFFSIARHYSREIHADLWNGYYLVTAEPS